MTSTAEMIGTTVFGLAVLHTFMSSRFERLSHRSKRHSIGEGVFHLLGEVEVVFGLWAGILIAALCVAIGPHGAIRQAESLNFTEPLFVFTIMAVAATRPVINAAARLILAVASIIPLKGESAAYLSCLIIGPFLGSLITEPPAMTVTALILKHRYFAKQVTDRFRYITLATLFVNISIGGVLTPFAAPPVLMVAGK